MSRIDVRPVSRSNWADFTQLFEGRGCPHFCWCTSYRFSDAAALSAADKKARMRQFVTSGTPIGVLAYDGDEPVGWCSIAPRESYLRLGRSRSMPRVTPPETSTWTVLCFFVARPQRGQGIARALLRGAIAHARAQGAAVIEAYPFDSAGISSTHRGHSSWFAGARFQQDGNRWVLERRRGQP
jgi:GNAT superfamily N-acetyltransferase